MQNRMDKYSLDSGKVGSRTERNKSLYESVKNSSMKNYEIKSNVSVIDDDADNINVVDVRKMLDERYSDAAPKRKSIKLPEFDNSPTEEPIQDTKEYDINKILAKAKQGKNLDYNKERLKKVRQTQYDILNNLDLEIKNIEEKSKAKTKFQEEAETNLKNLINTITELEIKNKKNDVSTELELLSDLSGDTDDEVIAPNKVSKDETKEEFFEDEEEPTNEIRLVRIGEKSKKTEKKEPRLSNTRNVVSIVEETKTIKEDKKTSKDSKESKKEQTTEQENAVEETLTKLDIKPTKFDDFADISKRDNGSLILKIIIFIVIILLVLGAIYILNDILGLGLF